jgi:hypothetical protein
MMPEHQGHNSTNLGGEVNASGTDIFQNRQNVSSQPDFDVLFSTGDTPLQVHTPPCHPSFPGVMYE